MHPEIRAFPSARFYGGRLQDGVPGEARGMACHGVPGLGPYAVWDVREGRDAAPEGGRSRRNMEEAELAAALLGTLLKRFPDDFAKVGMADSTCLVLLVPAWTDPPPPGPRSWTSRWWRPTRSR
jgi:superfamily I DNA and/or RNA helicase